MNPSPLLNLLSAHEPFDAHEQQMLERIVAFVRKYENFYSRHLLVGHLTGSAWIVDETFSHALLLHHGKLNKWLQPGGHIEDDADMLSAALREAHEETGVVVRPHSPAIFDVDIHEIPARPNEPAHFHCDVRFLLIADRTAPLVVTSESKDLAWVAIDEIETLTQEESVLRMVRKIRKARTFPPPLGIAKSMRHANEAERARFQAHLIEYMTQDCFPHLSVEFRGDLRMFAFFIGNCSLFNDDWGEELSEYDYRHLLTQKDEALGMLFTLYVNSWRSRKSDSSTKNHASFRAEQYLAQKIDPKYTIVPPFEDEEIARENTEPRWKNSIIKFAFSVGDCTLEPKILKGIDYLDYLVSEPSFLESVFAIFSNVLMIGENGEACNYQQAAFRAAQYIKSFCVSDYKIEPLLNSWETELH